MSLMRADIDIFRNLRDCERGTAERFPMDLFTKVLAGALSADREWALEAGN